MFSETVKELRLKHRMTQEELAARVNLTQNSVSAWERRGAVPPMGILTQLAKIFNVSIDYLLTGKKSNARECTFEELQLLEKYDRLTNDQKILIQKLLTELANANRVIERKIVRNVGVVSATENLD